jgi:hypothetical protein
MARCGPKPRPLADRFWEKVAVGSRDACWEWLAVRSRGGYGAIAITRCKTESAHRIAYTLCIGPIPKGACVCHTCDNKTCVNPAHLWLGTNAENTHDKVIKNRQYRPPRKTVCANGHRYTSANSYYPPGRRRRYCRLCGIARTRAWYNRARKDTRVTP